MFGSRTNLQLNYKLLLNYANFKNNKNEALKFYSGSGGSLYIFKFIYLILKVFPSENTILSININQRKNITW